MGQQLIWNINLIIIMSYVETERGGENRGPLNVERGGNWKQGSFPASSSVVQNGGQWTSCDLK